MGEPVPVARVQVVTSFSQEGQKRYGDKFVRSFLNRWPGDVMLWVGTEGASDIPGVDSGRVRTFDLDEDEDLQGFLEYTRKHHGEDHPTNYTRQPMKFARKVFAMTQPRLWSWEANAAEWWVWIDADVETIKDVGQHWMDRVFDDKHSLVYLARPGEKHSETGFVAFNLKCREGMTAWLAMRQYYVVAEQPRVFQLEQWHDSMVLDAVIKKHRIERTHSLTQTKGMHVWPDSVLGEVMRHNKGPRRKERAYGREL